jgi:hypothetical protein
MFGGHLLIAFFFIKAASIAIVLALSACVFMKMRNLRIKKKKAAYLKKHQPYFLYVQSNLEESAKLRVPPEKLHRLELEVIQDQLTEWIERLQGSQRDKLITLCEDLGLVKMHLKRLRRKVGWKKMASIYHLGMMRSRHAAPFLLEEMETHKRGPSLYILARSVAKCARDENDIRKMIQILVRHPKTAHHLAADIMKDSGFDLTRLAEEFLKAQDEHIIRIALIYLQGQVCFNLLPTLNRLLDADQKRLRIEAANVMLKSIPTMSMDWMNKLMKHQDWEIRALAAKTLGSWEVSGHIGLLLEGLKDSSWQVRYNSAKSLASSEKGFIVLCQAAANTKGPFDTGLLQNVIEEELWKGTSRTFNRFDHLRKQKVYEFYKRESAPKAKVI